LKVTLPDVNTESETVIAAYNAWIQSLVQEYNIDGLRIDGVLKPIFARFLAHAPYYSCQVRTASLSSAGLLKPKLGMSVPISGQRFVNLEEFSVSEKSTHRTLSEPFNAFERR
jgi:hypothetical protein